MFISTWKYPFLNDDLASVPTGAIPSADITENLLTAYQKNKAVYTQYTEERLSQAKSDSFFLLLRRINLEIFPSMNKKSVRIDR